MNTLQCSVEGCGKNAVVKGKCRAHFAQALGRLPKTPEQRAKMSAAALGRPKSEATRKAMSAAKKGKPGRPQSEAEKQATSERRRGVPWSSEQRAKMVGRLSHRWGVPPSHAKRDWYKGVSFRSSWEVKVAKALDAREIPWHYEAKRFDLGECTYLPDFYLPEDDAYWEVKGWFDEKAQRKASLFRSLYPETPLVVLTKQALDLLEA